MGQQEFNAPVDQVAGHDIHNHWGGESEPPDDPEKSLQCFQCERLTWRFTQFCRHCGLDLFAWREHMAEQDRAARLDEVRRRRLDMAKLAGMLSAALIGASFLVPSGYKGEFSVMGLVAGALALHWLSRK